MTSLVIALGFVSSHVSDQKWTTEDFFSQPAPINSHCALVVTVSLDLGENRQAIETILVQVKPPCFRILHNNLCPQRI